MLSGLVWQWPWPLMTELEPFSPQMGSLDREMVYYNPGLDPHKRDMRDILFIFSL